MKTIEKLELEKLSKILKVSNKQVADFFKNPLRPFNDSYDNFVEYLIKNNDLVEDYSEYVILDTWNAYSLNRIANRLYEKGITEVYEINRKRLHFILYNQSCAINSLNIYNGSLKFIDNRPMKIKVFLACEFGIFPILNEFITTSYLRVDKTDNDNLYTLKLGGFCIPFNTPPHCS